MAGMLLALLLSLAVQSTCVCAVHQELVGVQRRWPNRACSGAKRDQERMALLHLATATATWAHRQHQRSIVALRGGAGSVPFSASANAETSKRGGAAQSPWQVLWTLSLPDLHLVMLALVALTLAG